MDLSSRKQTLEVQRTRLTGAASGIGPGIARQPRDVSDLALRPQGTTAPSAWPDPLNVAGTAVPSSARIEELRRVEAALARLREGSYGFCQICGDEIGADWLDQRPATPFCKSCAQ